MKELNIEYNDINNIFLKIIKRREEQLNRNCLMVVRSLRRKRKLKGRLTSNKLNKLGVNIVTDHLGFKFVGKFKNGKLIKRLSESV